MDIATRALPASIAMCWLIKTVSISSVTRASRAACARAGFLAAVPCGDAQGKLYAGTGLTYRLSANGGHNHSGLFGTAPAIHDRRVTGVFSTVSSARPN
jgi:hypothetical protein